MFISYKDALNKTLETEMNRDSGVFLMGEDIGIYGGAFGVTKGLWEKFGETRILETPISEASLMGIATGSALTGMRPVLEIMFMDFCTLIMDQVVNHTVKFKYMFGGSDKIKVPLVIRTPYGGGRAYGSSHSQSLEGFFLHTPGIKILVPYSPKDACGLLRSAIREDNPVLFLENKLLYTRQGDVPEDPDFMIPMGKAEILREGQDLTLISYGRMLDLCISAGEELEKEGYSIEIINLRSLSPMDMETIFSSIAQTGRVVIVEEGTRTGGICAEISARITESDQFWNLLSPIRRVSAKDLPIPYSPKLEESVLPSYQEVLKGCRDIL